MIGTKSHLYGPIIDTIFIRVRICYKLSYSNSCKNAHVSMPQIYTCPSLYLNENFRVKIEFFTKWPLDMCAFCRSCCNLVCSKSLPFLLCFSYVSSSTCKKGCEIFFVSLIDIHIVCACLKV